jgi:hypothetical protein
LGLSFTTDKQKEAAWRMEFEALGEQSVLKNVKQGESYNEAKRQAAFRWLSEQAQSRDRRGTRIAELAWFALFVAIVAVSIYRHHWLIDGAPLSGHCEDILTFD